ncbi:MAG: type II secretion system F family protein [Candidatus Eremiobacteraeota bacterium]|nr:type II secretion system F family protein [Candidatus Eremiobacteraeota bacterium]
MPYFHIRGLDTRGKRVKFYRESPSEKKLIEDLKNEGFTILAKEEIKSEEGVSPLLMIAGKSVARPPVEDLAVATRQLSTILAAGINLPEGLKIIVESSESKSTLREVFREVLASIQQGTRPEAAFRKFPMIFSPQYISLITLGMSTGRLQETLNTLAGDLEKENALRKKIFSALTYPIFTFLFSFLLNGVIFVFILPKIISILLDLKANLPILTKLMYSLTKVASNPIAVIFMLIAAAVIWIQLKYYVATPVGRYNYDMLKLYFPVFGSLNRLIFAERFSRTMGMLCKYGIPIQESITITSKVCGNTFLEEHLFRRLRQEMEEGRHLEEVLAESPFMPQQLTHLVAAGSASGDIADPLRQAAIIYENDIMNSVQKLVTLIEPLMIVFMSAFILITILSIMMPLYHLIQKIGG